MNLMSSEPPDDHKEEIVFSLLFSNITFNPSSHFPDFNLSDSSVHSVQPQPLFVEVPSYEDFSVSSSSSLLPSSTYATTTTMTSSTRGPCDYVVKDVSSINYPGTITHMPLWEQLIKCVVVGILTLAAVIGNVLVIVIVGFSKKMKTTTNYYIVNLAVADLMVACFPMWIYVTTNVTDGWIVGGFLCKFNAFVQTSAVCAISFTMMAIAGDRFFAIVFPLKARVTQSKVKFVVATVWLCAMSIGIPPALYYTYTERPWSNYVETFCADIWPMVVLDDGRCDQGKTAERVYWTVVVAVLNWIPMLMMTINYTVIIHRLQFTRVAHSGSDSMSAVQRRSARRVVKMLFTLLITFMVCTIPFQVTTIFESYKDPYTRLPSWYKQLYFSAITLMYAHSTINPIVYGAMNQTFRNGFRHLIDRIRNRKKSSWESQMTAVDSIRPNISIVDNGDLETKNGTSLTQLVQCSSQLSLAVLKDGNKLT